jgi:hypothetical protein
MAMEGPLSECGAIGSIQSTLVIPGEVNESLNELSREMIQGLKAMCTMDRALNDGARIILDFFMR